MKASATTAAPAFSIESWAQFHAAAEDPTSLPSFAEFERITASQVAEIEAMGVAVKRVPIDVSDLVEWCAANRQPVGLQAAAAYAMQVLGGIDDQPYRPPTIVYPHH